MTDTSKTGMGRYLNDPEPSAQQSADREHAARTLADEEGERKAPVTSIGTEASNALTATLRDPEKRKAYREAERTERAERQAESDRRRTEAANAVKPPTEVADPTSKGMSRYLRAAE